MMAKTARAWLGLALLLAGYITLSLIDWRIALAVFAINWSINLDMSMKEPE